MPAECSSKPCDCTPPAWVITRRAIQADEISGYPIPPASMVIISPYTIHCHPAFWQQPERFGPQRFAAAGEESRPRYAYIPFGGGPRLCIGSYFAEVEAKLVLAMVTQRFRLTPASRQPVEAESLVTLRPRHGLPMRAQPLKAN